MAGWQVDANLDAGVAGAALEALGREEPGAVEVGCDGKALQAVGKCSVLQAGAGQYGPRRDARKGAVGQRGLDAFGKREEAVEGCEAYRGAPNGPVGAALARGAGQWRAGRAGRCRE